MLVPVSRRRSVTSSDRDVRLSTSDWPVTRRRSDTSLERSLSSLTSV